MARWSIKVDTFNMNVKYFEGKKIIVADFLSRIEGDALSVDVLKNCETQLSTDKETKKEKLNLNDIELTDDEEAGDADENDGNDEMTVIINYSK